MAPATGKGAKDMASGAVLQMVEAATLGMPLEVGDQCMVFQTMA